MKMICITCGKKIPEGRLKALPKTDTCIDCSTSGKKVAFKIIESKTEYSELEIVNADSNIANDFNRLKCKGFHATFMHQSPLVKNLKLNEYEL